MWIERVARTLLGAVALCCLLTSAGCNAVLSGNSPGVLDGTPVPASVKAPGDWGASLTAGVTVGIGRFPAKFTFDVTAAPDCANDYVAFNTTALGAQATTAASQTATFPNANNIPAGTFTITNGATALVLTASTILNTGNNFLVVNNTAPGNTTNATSLAAKIAALGGTVGVTASAAANMVTITALINGIGGNSIRLTKSISNLQLTLGGATLAGGVGRANIVAFNNLYSTQGSVGGLCLHDGPSVDWAYYTGTVTGPGTAVTSVVLSLDGSKVAFVENVGTQAYLRILKWKAGEGTGAGYPVEPTTTLAAATTWTAGCPAGNSCLRSIAFTNVTRDTRSAPFYSFDTDTLYVGDIAGAVHKFTPVFADGGAPAEVTTGGWPFFVHAGFILTSPVYDGFSGNIFVGDSAGRLNFIREVGSTVGACGVGSPPCIGSVNLTVGTGGAIVDAPIVDGTTGMVFAVNGTETSANHGTITQANTALVGQFTGAIGGSGAINPAPAIYSGAFDNTYIASSKPTIAGHMYVCGQDSNNSPYVYQLSFTAATGVVSGVGTKLFPAGTGFTSGTAVATACSPVTEFYNPNGGGLGVAKDWIFFSIANLANTAVIDNPIPAGACRANNAGCVLSIDVTGNPAWPPALPTTLVLAAPVRANNAGSTSGIVVDNSSILAQASNFYFTLGINSITAGPGIPSCYTTAGVGCAVKLTQSLLN
jgi:hypothetical protein